MKSLLLAASVAVMFIVCGCGGAPDEAGAGAHAAHIGLKPGGDAAARHAMVVGKALAHGWRVDADGPSGIDLYRKHLRIRVTCAATAIDIVQTGGAWDASPLIGALADDIGRAAAPAGR